MPETSEGLEEIKKKLAEIDKKLDQMLGLQSRQLSGGPYVPSTLASLPKHLKKTASTIAAMGEATAEQVSAKTGRTRAAESDYLNQLASRGFLKKQRKKREVYFQVFALRTVCPKCGARVPMTFDHCVMCGASLEKTINSAGKTC